MPENATEQTATEAVGVFESAETFQDAIDELLSAGFNQAELSLMADEKTVEKKLGHLYSRTEEMEDEPAVPRIAYISNESHGDAKGALVGGLTYVGAIAAVGAVVASGGAATAAIVAGVLAGGTSGLIGGILAELLGQHHADYLQKQISHGGLLLWVRTRDAAHEARALEILKKHAAHDVHLHRIPSLAA